jgi:hypothetical protein
MRSNKKRAHPGSSLLPVASMRVISCWSSTNAGCADHYFYKLLISLLQLFLNIKPELQANILFRNNNLSKNFTRIYGTKN